MAGRRSPLLTWLIRLAVLTVVLAGLLAALWGARLACEANPGCPWSTM